MTTATVDPGADLIERDITCEEWREYDFQDRVYRITNPKTLVMRPGGTTHRIVDANGVAHCVPVPGTLGCVLRWKHRDTEPKSVKF